MNMLRMSIPHPLRRWQALCIVLAVGVVLAGCGMAPTDDKMSGGETAPAFSGETFAGAPYSLADSAGRPVLINFWFPSCPPCSAELPDLQEAYHRYGDRIDFIGIQQLGLDTKAAGIAFLEERGITYPNMADEQFSIQSTYEVLQFPTTIFLDSDHNINRRWEGLISKKNLEEQIEAVIDG